MDVFVTGHRPAGEPFAIPSRRRFLRLLAGAAAAVIAPWPARAAAPHSPFAGLVEHPAPRPGIDASRVLRKDQLRDAPHLVRLFDNVREIPHIVDGIGCYCGCGELEGYRSLLSCYEGAGMARHCAICQGQARLAYNRSKEGQTLEQIRRATDARYGHGAGESAAEPHVAHHNH